MDVRNYLTQDVALVSWMWINPESSDTSLQHPDLSANTLSAPTPHKSGFDVLAPLRRWLDGLVVRDRDFAHFVCRIIPPQCPFERDVKLFGRVLFHIPPMCKLNPLYDEVVGLRFRALCFLADECGEDISAYC